MKNTIFNRKDAYISIFLCVISIMIICFIGIPLYKLSFTTQKSEKCYTIKRTKDYPYKVVKISKEYKIFDNNQFIPIKGLSKIGLEYFCTIEMMDSTFIDFYTNNYVQKFHYEGLRFYVWNLIKLSTDSTFNTINSIKESANDIKVVYNSQKNLPDTILYKGLKIYDIEPYTYEKYLEKDTLLYDVERYEKFEGRQ